MNRSPHERRARRHALTTTGLALAMAVLTACAPAGEPSGVEAPDSIRTPFSNEEEAFRAAEATYRAYVDALNQVDLADPATFEHVYEWLTGEALVAARAEFSRMSSERLTVRGTSRLALSEVGDESHDERVFLFVCVDVSGVDVLDASGRSTISPERPSVHPLTIQLDRHAGHWRISLIGGRRGTPTCG